MCLLIIFLLFFLIDFQNCCWCRRPVAENAPEFLTTTDGPRYCSESCFTQSRRASFKKAKTCDWCKHTRHAVSYVDFQDGASQLQFCSDKCLNQYKMQIFCKETQAHLDMNPHLRDQTAGHEAGLITPDLWLRNCRSRSVSPASTISVSPGPGEHTMLSIGLPPLSPPRVTTPAGNQSSLHSAHPQKSGHKPMISVAPVSKLMSKSPNLIASRSTLKNNRRKRPLRSCAVDNNTANLTRSSLKPGPHMSQMGREIVGKTVKSSMHPNSNNVNSLQLNAGHHPLKSTNSATLSQFAGSSVQDLHMSMPPLSPMLDQSTTLPHHAVNANSRGTSIPAGYFATPAQHTGHPASNMQGPPPQLAGYSPTTRPHVFPNLANQGATLLPRFLGPSGFPGGFQPPPTLHPSLLPLNQTSHPDMSCLSALMGPVPPVTVMVPYPIIIPLPIPIPVPLPIIDFYKAHGLKTGSDATQREQTAEETQQAVLLSLKAETPQTVNSTLDNIPAKSSSPDDHNDVHADENEPLDFTKSKDSFMPDENGRTTTSQQLPLELTQESSLECKIDAGRASTTPNKPNRVKTPSPPVSISPVSREKITHCIAEIDTNMQRDSNTNSPDTVGSNNGDDAGTQKLPKFKITRLQTKRTLIQAKETCESSRPLRKRKRIIDCDFQKFALKETETNGDNEEQATTSETQISPVATEST